jgi:hypothetical protein
MNGAIPKRGSSARRAPAGRNRPGRGLPAAACLAALLAPAGATAQSAVFDHTATAANIDGSRTYVSHPLLDARPDAVFFVTHHWNPPGISPRYNDHPIGVIYVGLAGQRWAITNRDNAAMEEDTTFTIWVGRDFESGSSRSFRHTTELANVVANRTRVSDADLNAQPTRNLAATPVFEDEVPDDMLGVWYEGSGQNRWTVFIQQAFAAMPLDLDFNVCLGGCGVEETVSLRVHDCVPSATSGNVCALPEADDLTRQHRLLVTPGWDGVYLTKPFGVFWASAPPPGHWALFLEDTTATFPDETIFHVKSTGLLYVNGFEAGTFFGWEVSNP